VVAEHAAEFASHAAGLDVAAVMALPPYTRRGRLDTIVSYYSRIADAAALPVIVQSVDARMGSRLDDSGIEMLLNHVPEIRAIKEERAPTPQRIGGLAVAFGDRLDGIFGGSNGQWLTAEARRGATGCMPATAVVDLQVTVQRLLDSGDWAAATAAQARFQPLVSYLSLYGVAMVKQLLIRRGIVRDATVRDPEAPQLNDGDLDELDRLANAAPDLFIGGDGRSPTGL
jgi:4-hydroxy-tetrahydrodipicolinate synthase